MAHGSQGYIHPSGTSPAILSKLDENAKQAS